LGKLVDNSNGAVVIDLLTTPNADIVQAIRKTSYDGQSFENIQAILLAMAQGRIRENPANSGTFEFYAQDNTTLLYTLQKTATERQRL
jgi:hypothetical protein